jgi:cysteine desulfurase family protein (TIGR01976 family)
MLSPDAVNALRAQFPALIGGETVFFDNPGGTQVPEPVIHAVTEYYRTRCANVGGAFETSRRTDETVAGARRAMADLLGAPDPDTIVFGPSMTALAFHIARSLAREIRPGDEVIVTDLDHDANITPWTDLAAAGATVRTIPFDTANGTLMVERLYEALRPGRTKLVAVGAASNALGTTTDLAPIIQAAHAAGALVFVDAVQAVPHLPTDVAALGCDFLACSAYKFFGPHVGVLYGKREYLERLTPHKVRPARDTIPHRWEQGTLNHEGLAGVTAAVAYLAALGEGNDRRERLTTALRWIRDYERTLSSQLLMGLSGIPGVRIYGIADPSCVAERLPTVAFTKQGEPPRGVCERLGSAGICAWNGNYYALRVMERLGLEESGGAVRVGLCHYNTPAEIDRFLSVLGGAP